MRRFLAAAAGFLLIATPLLPALAQTNDDDYVPPGQYHIKIVPFDELSEKSVSRQGDAALALPSVHWQHSESDHFIFHTETGFSVPQLSAWAEWSYALIKQDIGVTTDSYERKCHIYVFLNPQVWHEFVGTGKMEEWTGGWCTGRELFFASRPHFKFQGPTLPHEMTHLVLHRFIAGDIPLWLNEGFAEFEGVRLYRNYLRARGYTLGNVPDHLDRADYIPLSELTSAVDYPRERDTVVHFYNESRLLVAFFYYQHGGMNPLLKFIRESADGNKFDSAWQDVYSSKYSGIDSFETRFIAYVTKQKPAD
ncbi:MAG TPA: hypothetical protein VMP11_07830 [Verrucomicrobiae bacterium]|nr:hypothetical protein [Verrucomicrobiae bacterium]